MKKKILAIIVVVVIAAVSLAACGNEKYDHADNWDSSVVKPVDISKGVAEWYDESMSFAEMLGDDKVKAHSVIEIKEYLSDYIGKYNFLNWENLEGIESTLQPWGVGEVWDELSTDGRAAFNQLEQDRYLYDCAKKKLLNYTGNSESMEEYDDEWWSEFYMEHREILRALISLGDEQTTPSLEEGLLGYFAVEMMDFEGQSYTPDQQVGILTIRCLIAMYGEEEVLKMIYNNNITDKIDSTTKKGMAEKLDKALYVAKKENNPEMANIIFDIIVHMAIKEHKTSEIKNYLATMEALYPTMDKEYFDKLLS